MPSGHSDVLPTEALSAYLYQSVCIYIPSIINLSTCPSPSPLRNGLAKSSLNQSSPAFSTPPLPLYLFRSLAPPPFSSRLSAPHSPFRPRSFSLFPPSFSNPVFPFLSPNLALYLPISVSPWQDPQTIQIEIEISI